MSLTPIGTLTSKNYLITQGIDKICTMPKLPRHSIAGDTISQSSLPCPESGRLPSRRKSFLTLNLGHHLQHAGLSSPSGSASNLYHHLHLPTFTFTTPEADGSRRFHFGLRRHSNTVRARFAFIFV